MLQRPPDRRTAADRQRQYRQRQRNGEAVFRVRVGHPVIEALIESKRLGDGESDVATIMARHLPPAQRTAVVWHLAAAAEELDAQWQ